MLNTDNSATYSNIIKVTKSGGFPGISIYPNPVTDLLTIEFKNSGNHVYKISLMNLLNQVISENTINSGVYKKFEIKRTKAISPGIYIVRFVDLTNNDDYSQKVIFR